MVHSRKTTLLTGSALALSVIGTISSTSLAATSQMQMFGSLFGGCACINDSASKVLSSYKQKGSEIGVTDQVWFKASTDKFAGQIESGANSTFVDNVIKTIMKIEPGRTVADKLTFLLMVVDSAKLSSLDLQAIHGVAQYKAHQLIGRSGNITVYDLIDSLEARIEAMAGTDDSDSTDGKTVPTGGTYAKDRAGVDKRVAA